MQRLKSVRISCCVWMCLSIVSVCACLRLQTLDGSLTRDSGAVIELAWIVHIISWMWPVTKKRFHQQQNVIKSQNDTHMNAMHFITAIIRSFMVYFCDFYASIDTHTQRNEQNTISSTHTHSHSHQHKRTHILRIWSMFSSKRRPFVELLSLDRFLDIIYSHFDSFSLILQHPPFFLHFVVAFPLRSFFSSSSCLLFSLACSFFQ